MAWPYAADAGGADYEPALPEFVGNADLAECRLLKEFGQRRVSAARDL